mmetsp:Transcript_37831/g.118706  ORF Transcript_37831/g.118706 Transcript_37831/m.118706 type:complete len:250 (+) Transcript_37831:368-1117(+)
MVASTSAIGSWLHLRAIGAAPTGNTPPGELAAGEPTPAAPPADPPPANTPPHPALAASTGAPPPVLKRGDDELRAAGGRRLDVRLAVVDDARSQQRGWGRGPGGGGARVLLGCQRPHRAGARSGAALAGLAGSLLLQPHPAIANRRVGPVRQHRRNLAPLQAVQLDSLLDGLVLLRRPTGAAMRRAGDARRRHLGRDKYARRRIVQHHRGGGRAFAESKRRQQRRRRHCGRDGRGGWLLRVDEHHGSCG